MIPSKKISQTVLEFGKSIIAGLPVNYTKEEFEATMKVVVTAWNAVVMDSWGNGKNSNQSCWLLWRQPLKT